MTKNAIRLFLILAAALAAFAVAPAGAEGLTCRQTALYDASTNGSTLLVASAPGGRVICGFTLVGGGTATVGFVYGTGVACATGETKVTPAYSLVAQTVVSDSSPVSRGLFVPPGNDLCIKTSAGVAVQAQIYHVQR